MPNVHWRHWEPGFHHHLSDDARAQFEACDALYLGEIELFAETFRAVIDGRPDAFAEAFSQLHPSPHERLVSLAMLNNLSLRLHQWKLGEAPVASVCSTEGDSDYFGGFFTAEDSEVLRQRLAVLDARLRLPKGEEQRGWQRWPSPYQPTRCRPISRWMILLQAGGEPRRAASRAKQILRNNMWPQILLQYGGRCSTVFIYLVMLCASRILAIKG
jgi:hypothetical protein